MVLSIRPGLFFTKNDSVSGYNNRDMAAIVEMHNIGQIATRSEIVAVVEHVLSDKPGTWRVTIVGSRATDNWEMKVEGPKGFERSYSLSGKSGEHEPKVIGNVLSKLVPTRGSAR
jgi:hypothetical protein